MDPRLAVSLQVIDDIYAEEHAHMLLASRAITAFSLVSFGVALAGLYGVVAFLVASRTREIGIRMALGAAAGDIRRMVLVASGRMAIVGTIAGLGLAFFAARATASQLFGVSPADPVTYLLVGATACATAILATWMPARRAAATDPAMTLRSE
jgi:ABC-type antimicrobial peptide transport system permease subunit